MTLKTKFILLSILVAISTSVFSFFVIQRYHAKIPVINRMFADQTMASQPKAPVNQYEGLKPESIDPDGVYYQNRVLILMYHDLSPNPIDKGTLSVANFEQQLELMKSNNFHWITMSQYRDFILHDSPVPDNAVLLTFDDGYESLYTYAFPLLKKYQAPASSFLIVNAIDNPLHTGVPKVTWEQVELMHKNGIDFFSHTYDSHKFALADPASDTRIAMLSGPIFLKDENRLETETEYEQRVTDDLKKANDILRQKLGRPNYVLAFPYGEFSKSLPKIGEELGIDLMLTVRDGLNKAGQTTGFRVNAGGVSNDPVLQLSLMKHAETLLGSKHFDDGSEARLYTLSAMLFLMLLGVFWLWMGRRLLVQRSRAA